MELFITKQTSYYRVTLVVALIFIVSFTAEIYAQSSTITITQTSAGITQTNYDSGAERNWSQDGVSFTANYVMKEGGQANLQLKASDGILYNTTPLPGKIISITIYQHSNTNKSVLQCREGLIGSSEQTIGSSSSTGWTSGEFIGTDFTYFSIKRNTGVAYWTSFVIEYEIPTPPSNTCASIDFNDPSQLNGWTVSSPSIIGTGQACAGKGAVFSGAGQHVISPLVSYPQYLSFENKRSGNAASWLLNIEYSTSISGPWNHLESTGTITTNCETRNFDLSSINDEVYIRLIDARLTEAHQRTLDDIQIFCSGPPPCVSTANISSFMPNSGPEGSLISISGSGFTSVTAVLFGTIHAASFTIVNDQSIIAEVPAGLGKNVSISVVDDNSCAALSTSKFSYTNFTGACAQFASDIFISEVFDAVSGNNHYIEIYNYTGAAINLASPNQYKLSINGITEVNLAGTLNHGTALVVYCGANGAGLSNSAYNLGSGFNTDDDISLLKNGTVIDQLITPNYAGFSIIRNSNVYAPNNIYDISEWDINSHNNILALPSIGSHEVDKNLSPIITSSPIDVTACSINLSVASTTPNVSYQWKYNDPSSMTDWKNVNIVNLPSFNLSGETTDNLVITGNTILLTDFQFFCDVTSLSCTRTSNAAQFTYDGLPIYRSTATANGNWSDVLNWEMSDDYIHYIPACTYPRSNNSSEISIQSGTNIVLDLTGSNSMEVNRITIENNASLELLPHAKLSVYDGVTGADLIVNGTLFDRNSTSNGIDLSGGATWKLGINGTIIKSNDGAISTYRDNYEGGMSSIPPSANWIFRYNGDGNPRLGTSGFFYPNLTFENTTTSAYSWNNPTAGTSFRGTVGFATVKGDFNVGITGTASCHVSNVNTSAQPMKILQNINIAAGSSLNTDAASEYGTGFDLKGNLFVDGELRILDGATERVLQFTGTGNQTISGTGMLELHKMTINKTSGDIILNRDLRIQNELLMLQGNIFTNSNQLELGLSINQKGILTHTNGFVVGKMRRWFDGTNSGNESGLYPMGFEDGGLKNRNVKIEFTNAPADGGHLTVEYIGLPMNLAGIPILASNTGGAGFDILSTENQGYWKIENETGKLIDAAYTISCTGEGFQTITDLNKLTLLKRIGSGNWFCPGTYVSTTGTISKPIVSRAGVTNWSNFGFGGGIGNPLPITLTEFHHSCDENKIQLHWTTASELNASHFILEKSRDLSNWSLVSNIEAAGNSSNDIKYSSIDFDNTNDVFYYRLKQVDYNGEFEIYGPISVTCDKNNNVMNVYPNPSFGNFTVELAWNNINTRASLQVVDLTGKVFKELDLNLKTGLTQLEFSEKGLQMGTYFIRLKSENGFEVKPARLVILKD